MKKRHKRKIKKIFRISWFSAGAFLILWTLFFLIKTQSTKNPSPTGAILFAAGLYIFLIYIITTMILVIVHEIIKRIS